MFAIFLLASLGVIATYFVCRASLVARLRAEAPALLVSSNEHSSGGALLFGVTLTDPLLDRLEHSNIDPSSSVWRHANVMRLCVVALVALWVVAALLILWPGAN